MFWKHGTAHCSKPAYNLEYRSGVFVFSGRYQTCGDLSSSSSYGLMLKETVASKRTRSTGVVQKRARCNTVLYSTAQYFVTQRLASQLTVYALALWRIRPTCDKRPSPCSKAQGEEEKYSSLVPGIKPLYNEALYQKYSMSHAAVRHSMTTALQKL